MFAGLEGRNVILLRRRIVGRMMVRVTLESAVLSLRLRLRLRVERFLFRQG
jgi:hypothetical protein